MTDQDIAATEGGETPLKEDEVAHVNAPPVEQRPSIAEQLSEFGRYIEGSYAAGLEVLSRQEVAARDALDQMMRTDLPVEEKDWCNCQAVPGTPQFPGPWHERGGEPHYPCAEIADEALIEEIAAENKIPQTGEHEPPDRWCGEVPRHEDHLFTEPPVEGQIYHCLGFPYVEQCDDPRVHDSHEWAKVGGWPVLCPGKVPTVQMARDREYLKRVTGPHDGKQVFVLDEQQMYQFREQSNEWIPVGKEGTESSNG